ncbi:hypothetical protein [Natronorubrum thiooxidans]|uniref:Uncharacterized protein n=1 Tax=Natronorubrum thiooxidans TaxID=308853 RepID=A0A1N7FC08_9EURY|nr:hypothetical protein [Natronorubrum thiooxidans]SIR97853.1 hypothetical protein SAMN05421752_106181 [Natronorubrum thiooxidans]
MTPSRRDVLRLAGTTATAAMAPVGIAGTVTVTAQEPVDGDLPAYSQWLPVDDGGLEFAFVDWAALDEYVQDELETANPNEAVPAAYEADPMIAPVSEGSLSTYLFVGLTLGQFRLGRLLDDEAFESTIEGLLRTTDAFVVTGRIDPAEIDAQITAAPEAEFIRQLERTDEIEGYDVYTPVSEATDAAIAVGDEALVIVTGEDPNAADDPRTRLERPIGASTGTADRMTDASEAFAWTLERAGDGDVIVGQYGDGDGVVDFAFDGLEDAESIVSSLTVEDEETSTGEFAAVIDDLDEATLEAVLGASADERSLDIEDDRVTATGMWRERN